MIERKGELPAFNIFEVGLISIFDAQTYLEKLGLGDFLFQLPTSTAKMLRDLVQRPLFLDMISQTAGTLRASPSKGVTELTLFDDYVEGWWRRSLRQTANSEGQLKLHHVAAILEGAAYLMNSKRSDAITDDDLDTLVQDELERGLFQLSLSGIQKQARERLILVPDFTERYRRLTFRHDSLRAYFAARALANLMKLGKRSAVDLFTLDDVSLAFFLLIARRDTLVRSTLESWYEEEISSSGYRADGIGATLLLWSLHTKRQGSSEYLRTFFRGVDTDRHALKLLLGSLQEMDLANLDFSQLSMSGAKLTKTILTGADFLDTDLTGADLTGARLARAKLIGTKVRGAVFSGARFERALIEGVYASSVVFDGCKFEGATLKHCTFFGPNTRFAAADFHGATLESVSFESVELPCASFDLAKATNCSWTKKCNLSGASFRGIDWNKNIISPDCQTDGAIGIDPDEPED